jgi:hypothetical protein
MMEVTKKEKTAPSVIALVSEVKKAILEAQDHLNKEDIGIESFDLEISTILKKNGEGSIDLSPIPIELGGNVSENQVQKMRFSFIPKGMKMRVIPSDFGKELVSAINLMSVLSKEASETDPPFDLNSAELNINFETEMSGKIKVIFGTSESHGTGHSVRILMARQNQ